MDFAGLKRAIVDWLEKPELEQAVTTFIEFAEAEFNRDLRTQKQIKRATAVTSSQFVELPTDWLEAKNIQLNTVTEGSQPSVLHYKTMDFSDRARELYTGDTAFYTLHGNQLELLPAPSGEVTIEMVYFRTIPALSDAVTTNWLLEAHPDLYVYGSLLHASPFLGDDPRLMTWNAGFTRAKQSLIDSSARALVSGSPLIRKLPTFG